MAAVLGAFVSKLAFIMMGMAKEEVELLLGVPGEITKLETTLGDLSSILADAERRRVRSAAVERWVRELKDAVYDVDDILDLCQIMEDGEDPTAPAAGVKRPSAPRRWKKWNVPKLFCFRNPVAAHEIGKKIQALNKRLFDIAERSSRFGFLVQQINSSPALASSAYAAAATSLSHNNGRMTGSSIIQSDVVGEKIEEDTKKLVDLLVKRVEPNDPTVVVAAVITGAGGIGKTTLARMVFNTAAVVEHFDQMIWLSVTKEVDGIGVMQRVIAAFGASYDGLAGDIALLESALKQLVWQKKILLVMDDVWSDEVWNNLLRVPLNGSASGSRVLVTTRDEEVARGLKARHLHRVDKLQEEDAWILLKKQVVSSENDECEVDRLKDIGMKILNRCDGLPLAIKVLGGYLLKISRTKDAWTNVCNHFAWSAPRINEDIHNAVVLSYEELPSHLKQCFIFCSLFPKDVIIRCAEVIQFWVAEGYVDNTSPKLPEDLGLDYYKELISRNLLESKKGTFLSESTMHDVIRSFAQYITKDEGVLVSEGQNVKISPSVSKLRHLSISNMAVEWDALQKQASLRTLMLFRSTIAELTNICKNLSCLRVLCLDNVDLVELPDSIHHLKHLRFLRLSFASISMIPQVIGDLKFLQAFDLLGCKNITQLPNTILKLRKLRLLNIGGTSITSVPRGFGYLENLAILAGFPFYLDGTDNWCSLQELGPLSKLELLDITGIRNTPSGSMAAGAKLHSKQHLTDLTLIFASTLRDNGELDDTITEEEKEQIKEVLSNLCPPSCIEKLVIRGYFGNGLPRWVRTMSGFECLTQLVLEGYACCKQLPSGLGQLPSLEYFWVERAPCIRYIGHDLLLPSLSRNGGAFPKLTRLGFEDMLGWTEWDWEQQVTAMPSLEALLIDNCKLQRLPPGLAHHAGRLVFLDLRNFLHLVSIDNFPSLVELKTIDNPKLERISNCPSLQKIIIYSCPRLKLLEDSPLLRIAEWKDFDAETLPEYLREAQLNKLTIYCRLSLLKLISLQDNSSEWGKIQHVQQLKAYAACGTEKNVGLDGFIYYTKEPYSFEVVMCDSTVYAPIGRT